MSRSDTHRLVLTVTAALLAACGGGRPAARGWAGLQRPPAGADSAAVAVWADA